MKGKSVYQSRVGRYGRMTVAQLERLEKKHMLKIKEIEDYEGYYPERGNDLAKARQLLLEVRAHRNAKILQHALL